MVNAQAYKHLCSMERKARNPKWLSRLYFEIPPAGGEQDAPSDRDLAGFEFLLDILWSNVLLT